MELSPPLRWLGALAIMLVVVLIVVPMLLRTVGDLIVLAEESSEPAAEVSETASEVASEQVAAGDEGQVESGGSDAGQDGSGDDSEFPADYTVVAGDTGTRISEEFYGNPDGWQAIAEANNIDPSAPLRVGEELTIPAPE